LNKRQYLNAILETQEELGGGGIFLDAHIKGVEKMTEWEFANWIDRITTTIRRRWADEQRA